MSQSDQPIVLHGMGSPNVIKTIIMLEECQLDYELRYVSVFKSEQLSPEFLALNPLGKVPVLEDRRLDLPIAESGAILLWLAEREGKFLPADPSRRADVIQWLMFQMANYGPMFGQLNHFAMAIRRGTYPYAEGRYREIARRLYRVLDDHLRDRKWIAGGEYSIADMAMQPWANYLEPHKLDPAEHPALVEWRARVASRPAVKRANTRVGEEWTPFSEGERKAVTDENLDRFFGRPPGIPDVDYSNMRR